jgi:hypothetical protein
MKYTLTIEANSATELFDALVASATVYRLSDAAEPRDVPERELTDDEIASLPTPPPSAKVVERVTLPTGDDPSDVYGPGNGPVGAYRPDATPASEPTIPTVDANNMPHDERIHAGSKALNADGTWRKKRGVSDELIRSVEANPVHIGGGVVATEPVLVGEKSYASIVPASVMATYLTCEPVPERVLIGVDYASEPDMTAYLTCVPDTHSITMYDDGIKRSRHTPASIMSRIAALVTSGDKTPAYVQELAKSCDLADGIAQIASDSDALQRVVAALQADGVL